MENSNQLWFNRVLQGLIVFITSLLILSVYRMSFLFFFGNEFFNFQTFLDVFWIGVRVDAKWLALFLSPAWLCLWLSYRFNAAFLCSKILAVIGLAVIMLLDAVNIGFYDFYKTPINPLIFGLLQDDTEAVIKTIWSDWPVFTYLFVIFSSVALPFLCALSVKADQSRKISSLQAFFIGLFITVTLCITIRGSLGKFPLRQEDFAVSPIAVVNASVPNGPAALYEATKAWRKTQITGEPNVALKRFGLDTEEAAQKLLTQKIDFSCDAAHLNNKPNIVLAVMESMGRDVFFSHDAQKNNTLGSLEKALSSAVVFKNGISIANGTFPSLEGIIFDTPISPISQSIYGRKKLNFSQILHFKKLGYKTIFLTGCPERWRQIDETFKNYGFDEIIGQAAIHSKFPQAEKSPWGIGDKWMFRYAEDILAEAEKSKKPVFIFMLSTTNHAPYKVPDGDETEPTNPSALPQFITVDESKAAEVNELLKTYQYSANSLGEFVLKLEKEGWLKNTLIAATGDHNVRLNYRTEGLWHHVFGVPLLFWIPDEKIKALANPSLWVSHRDIIPSLLAVATGTKLGPEKGRNLFAKEVSEGSLSFIQWDNLGFVMSSYGLVALKGGEQYACYEWKGDRLIPVNQCSKSQVELGEIARAQRALSEYIVRSGIR